jgi:hypothetical protein
MACMLLWATAGHAAGCGTGAARVLPRRLPLCCTPDCTVAPDSRAYKVQAA